MAIDYLKQLFSNNASTYLGASIGAYDTTITVADGSKFPDLNPGEMFTITVSNGVDLEVIEVHGRSGDTFLNCVRGAEGTTAQTFASGSKVENRLTAGTIAQFVRLSDLLTPTDLLADLGKTELLNNSSYIISEADDYGNPIIAVASLGRWRFINYPNMPLTQLVGTTFSSTSVAYSSTTDLSTFFAERGMLIQFTTGQNRGQVRMVQSASSTNIVWATPLPYTLIQGDRFEVYQSSTARMDLMNSQVQWLLATAGLSGGSFSTFVTTSALQTELAKVYVKKAVRVATTTNITLSGLQTIDGIAVLGGDRVLVKDQTLGTQNGIYVADSGTWQRATDADANGEIAPGMVVGVIAGSTQADTFWKVLNDTDIILGTTSIVFADFLTGYAKLNSPAFTGVPTAPTAAVNTNTTQLANTAFTKAQIAAQAAPLSHVGDSGGAHAPVTTTINGFMLATDKVKLDGISVGAAAVGSITPLMDGTAGPGSSTSAARSDHIHPTDTSRAPLASPGLTGIPTAPTAPVNTNSTQLATTAFTLAQINTSRPFEATVSNIQMDGVASVGTLSTVARGDHVHPTDTTRAPLASPALTGVPTAPTAAPGTNTSQIATTAFTVAAFNSAISTSVQKDSNTGAAQMPVGTTAQRGLATSGRLRFNSDLSRYEGADGTNWNSLGGATGGGTDSIFYLNGQTISNNYTIPSGQNALTAGPITIANGITVTVPAGSVWTVV